MHSTAVYILGHFQASITAEAQIGGQGVVIRKTDNVPQQTYRGSIGNSHETDIAPETVNNHQNHFDFQGQIGDISKSSAFKELTQHKETTVCYQKEVKPTNGGTAGMLLCNCNEKHKYFFFVFNLLIVANRLL